MPFLWYIRGYYQGKIKFPGYFLGHFQPALIFFPGVDVGVVEIPPDLMPLLIQPLHHPGGTDPAADMQNYLHGYKISMASPILAFRHEISNVETFIELALVGTPDHTKQFTRGPGRNGTNEQLQE
jgi:hypothetical protein